MTRSAQGHDLRENPFRRMIVGSDQLVPLLDGSVRPYVYLDNAASTPAFREVQAKVDEFLGWYSGVHRGTGLKSLVATHAYDQAREIVTRFVGADPQTHVAVFGKNTTEAINKLANRIDWRPGDMVVTTVMEHHSNDLPWRPKAEVVHVGVLEDGSLDLATFERTLEQLKGRVRLVAVTGASNVSGFVLPIHDLSELAHRAGALFLADCAQLAPHRAVRMGTLDDPRRLDFVSLSAHKMYAPYGTGALIGPREFFARGEPDYRGGGTIDIVTLDDVHWAGPPERDEAGSPNVVGAVALAASMRILSQAGMEAIAAHEMELTSYLLRGLNRLNGVRIFGSRDPERVEDRLGVVSFDVRGVPHSQVAAVLGFEGGIGVRNGCFCAHPYILRLLGIGHDEAEVYKQSLLAHDRSRLPGLVRASLGCYNTSDDVDALVETLDRIIGGRVRGDYVLDKATGECLPRGFDPGSLSRYFSI